MALASKAGVGRWVAGRIEAADLDRLRLGDIERSFDALQVRLEMRALYRGAAADRLLDEGHALLLGQFVALLVRIGWEVKVEVSFSEYGERGSIDVLGWHAAERALLVVEIKSELGGLDATLRPLDVKLRLAPIIARRHFGWQPVSVSRMLVLPEGMTARRTVERHAEALRAALPERSRRLRSWLRQPRGAIAGIWFLSHPQAGSVRRNPSAVQRIRARHARPAGSHVNAGRGAVATGTTVPPA